MSNLLSVRDEIRSRIQNIHKVTTPNQERKMILQRFIKQKADDLQCPVCLEESFPPIFTCQEMQIICKSFKEKVKGNKCPVCTGSMRHRYAEKESEELVQLRRELGDLQ